jgi:hypothetical protein
VLEISLSFYLGYPIFLPDQRNPTTFDLDPVLIYLIINSNYPLLKLL